MPEHTNNPETLNRFKQKAAQFSDAYTRLLNVNPDAIPDKLKPEYENLKQKGAVIKYTVENATGAWDTITDISDTLYDFGYDAGVVAGDWIGGAWDNLTDALGFGDSNVNGLGQLGAVFTIPVILGVSGIAALTWFINSVYQFERKLAQAQRLVDKGKISEDQFLESISGNDSWLPNLTGLLPIIALVGGALLFLNVMDDS